MLPFPQACRKDLPFSSALALPVKTSPWLVPVAAFLFTQTAGPWAQTSHRLRKGDRQQEQMRSSGDLTFSISQSCWARASPRPPVTSDNFRESVTLRTKRHIAISLDTCWELMLLSRPWTPCHHNPASKDPASHSYAFPLFLLPGRGLPSSSTAKEGPREGL